MNKKLILLTFFLTNSLFATGPAIECRFAGLEDNGDVGFDEVVGLPLLPHGGISGDFDPYEIDLSVHGGVFTVDVDLHDDPISSVEIPVANVVHLPAGASIFGINTVYHKKVDGYVSVRYECIKIQ